MGQLTGRMEPPPSSGPICTLPLPTYPGCRLPLFPGVTLSGVLPVWIGSAALQDMGCQTARPGAGATSGGFSPPGSSSGLGLSSSPAASSPTSSPSTAAPSPALLQLPSGADPFSSSSRIAVQEGQGFRQGIRRLGR